MGRVMGRGRLLGREPGEEGGALGCREGRGGEACLGVDGRHVCLVLPVVPCRAV